LDPRSRLLHPADMFGNVATIPPPEATRQHTMQLHLEPCSRRSGTLVPRQPHGFDRPFCHHYLHRPPPEPLRPSEEFPAQLAITPRRVLLLSDPLPPRRQ